MKKIIFLVIIVAIGFGVYYFTKSPVDNVDVNVSQNIATTTNNTASSTTVVDKTKTVIGKSVQGSDIVAYHFGEGANEVIFVGGIHGGYAWNTALLAYEAMDYFKANVTSIPANIKVTIIPVLNPDGLNKVVGTSSAFVSSNVSKSQEVVVSGRYNANQVDLNRNFACDWQSTGKWQNKTVSGGTEAFSEPETLALKNYVETQNPKAVVAWYSAAGGVYSSNCHNGILATTTALTSAYAKASGYTANEDFDFYETTGDMTNWLAKIKIPAISVLLATHDSTEWSKNKAGIEAILKYIAK
jgi:hypothetical protein